MLFFIISRCFSISRLLTSFSFSIYLRHWATAFSSYETLLNSAPILTSASFNYDSRSCGIFLSKPSSTCWFWRMIFILSVSFCTGLSSDWICFISSLSSFLVDRFWLFKLSSLSFARSYSSLILSCLRFFSLSSSEIICCSFSFFRLTSTFFTKSPYSASISLNAKSDSGFPWVLFLNSYKRFSCSLKIFKRFYCAV